MNRRTLLTTLGSGTVPILSGCMGSGPEENSGESESPTDSENHTDDAEENSTQETPDTETENENSTQEEPDDESAENESEYENEKKLTFIALDQNGERVSGVTVHLWGEELGGTHSHDLGPGGGARLRVSRPGNYSYRAEADGYDAVDASGEVALMEDKEVILEFKRAEHRLTVQTPEPGMWVEVWDSPSDDEPLAAGRSNQMARVTFTVPEGRHTVMTERGGMWVEVDRDRSVSFE